MGGYSKIFDYRITPKLQCKNKIFKQMQGGGGGEGANIILLRNNA